MASLHISSLASLPLVPHNSHCASVLTETQSPLCQAWLNQSVIPSCLPCLLIQARLQCSMGQGPAQGKPPIHSFPKACFLLSTLQLLPPGSLSPCDLLLSFHCHWVEVCSPCPVQFSFSRQQLSWSLHTMLTPRHLFSFCGIP